METNAAAPIATKTASLKYALSDGMRRAVKAAKVAKEIQVSTLIVLVIGSYAASLAQVSMYADLFGGKTFPALLLSYAISLVASLIVYLVVVVLIDHVEEGFANKMVSDPLTKRVSSDFNVPEKLVSDALMVITSDRKEAAHFTHEGTYYILRYQTEHDEQLAKNTSFISVDSSPAKSISDELIVP